MGWFGYGIYDGDDTQTQHISFIKWSGIEKNKNVIFDWLTARGTIIPYGKKKSFIKNIGKITRKIKLPKYWNEDKAIEWQMLLSLLIDNKIKPPKLVFDKGVEATEYLIGQCCGDYDNPSYRASALRRFIKKAYRIKNKR